MFCFRRQRFNDVLHVQYVIKCRYSYNSHYVIDKTYSSDPSIPIQIYNVDFDLPIVYPN